MNKELCTIFRKRLEDLPFADMLAGMTQPVAFQQAVEEVGPLRKTMPVAYDTTDAMNNCHSGPERALVPDTSKKSIIYFEDYGLRPAPNGARRNRFISNVRLVCWLNRSLLVGEAHMEIAGRCMAEIMKRINNQVPVNDGMFVKLMSSVAAIPAAVPDLFGKYNYDTTVKQFLMPPFEFFALDIVSDFEVIENCLEGISWDLQECF